MCPLHERLQAAGVPIVLHVTTQPEPKDPATHLWCHSCPNGGTWRPDADFPRCAANPWRRGHHQECRDCSTERRRVRRLDPATREYEAARQRASRARTRARINGETRP